MYVCTNSIPDGLKLTEFDFAPTNVSNLKHILGICYFIITFTLVQRRTTQVS